ncbi:MAG: cytochrome c oxidase assembly protein [Solirubrobacteraceae bacterium]
MSWHGWSIQLPLLYVAVAASLYWIGGRGFRVAGRSGWHEASFAAGLATIVIALESPLDGYADKLFWVHMLQHVLLLTAAPPLILLGKPWPRMWRAIPLRWRAPAGRTLARARWTAPVRALARPVPAFVLFNATVLGWHLPAAYDATLTHSLIHDSEHAMFFFIGLLFWARVVDPGPLRPRLVWPMRLVFVVGSMVVGWGLAITLVMIQHPIYSFYADLASRPGGISALADQQLAAGVMWVPGSIAYGLTVVIGLYRWLEPTPPASRSVAREAAASDPWDPRSGPAPGRNGPAPFPEPEAYTNGSERPQPATSPSKTLTTI